MNLNRLTTQKVTIDLEYPDKATPEGNPAWEFEGIDIEALGDYIISAVPEVYGLDYPNHPYLMRFECYWPDKGVDDLRRRLLDALNDCIPKNGKSRFQVIDYHNGTQIACIKVYGEGQAEDVFKMTCQAYGVDPVDSDVEKGELSIEGGYLVKLIRPVKPQDVN